MEAPFDFEPRKANRLTRLGADRLGELLGAPPEDPSDCRQAGGALRRGVVTVRLETTCGRGEDFLHLIRTGAVMAAHEGMIIGAPDIDHVLSVDPRPIHKQTSRLALHA